MKKVAFVLEKDDPRLPIHKNSIDGYNQKKIKALTTKNLFSKTSTKKSDYKNLKIVAEKDLLNSLSVSPEQAYVINYLAYSWIEKGVNIEKSLEMLKKANDLKKNDGYIVESL